MNIVSVNVEIEDSVRDLMHLNTAPYTTNVEDTIPEVGVDTEDDSSERIAFAVDEVKKPRVDDPFKNPLSDHRKLLTSSRELEVMTLVMRDYARNDEVNDEQQLTAILNYIKKAHGIYLEAIYSFIEKAEGKRKNKESVPALPRVQKLLSTYDPSVTERLQHYYEKAKLSPENRSELSTRSEATRRSRLSDESRTIIHRMQQQHSEELSKLNDKLVDMTVSAEIAGIEQKRLKKQIQTSECERELLSSRIEKMSESVTKVTMDEKVQEEAAIKERGEMVKCLNRI